ncbi:MAG: golgi uridine diphosphate-N- acetylglucosamine transporter [Chrysothrix sp. TS-e1954]|nr:MAG: golgi uridine diphosphate-N- acetylglucosamine transporter [Chrysothrix sp. TS-e1954]
MFFNFSWFLIFGGCCSNVYTLEAIVKHEPDSGLIITVTQFLLTALFALPSQIERRPRALPSQTPPRPEAHLQRPSPLSIGSWRLKPLDFPFHRLATISFLFFAVNMLNNWAFAFDISVPMHILLRSFGSVMTLTVGWLWGKKYSVTQVSAIAALTVGVIVSAWADAAGKGATSKSGSGLQDHPSAFIPGLAILFTAQLIAAIMGVYVEMTYARFGRNWRQNLFYSHLLGLVPSLLLYRTVAPQLARLWHGPRATFPAGVLDWVIPSSYSAYGSEGWWAAVKSAPSRVLSQSSHDKEHGWGPSQSILLLLLNSITQVVCISGVNRLSAQTTAVTVTVVLNIRKLVSFLLSCAIFGNTISGTMAVGAVIVFASGTLYGWDSSRGGGKGRGRGNASHVREESQGRVSGGALGMSRSDEREGAKDVMPLANGNTGNVKMR